MAKKKQTHQQKSAEVVKEQVTHQNDETTPVIVTKEDNIADKLSNLKSLNQMLVKETASKRQEISALLDDKKLLEAELIRSESEVGLTRSELMRVKEELSNVELEKEADLTRHESESGLTQSELNRVREELRKTEAALLVAIHDKGESERGLTVKDGKVRELSERLIESESKQRSAKIELEGMRENYETVSKALRESEGKVQGLQKLILEFQGKVDNLNGAMLSLREDKEKWQVGFVELEKNNSDVVEELHGLKSSFGALLEEKKAKERVIEGLISEKSKHLEKLGDLEKEIESIKLVKEKVTEDKTVLNAVKLRQEKQISDLDKEVCELNAVVSSLREEAENWQVKFNELEKSNVDAFKELDWLKSGFAALLEEKKVKESEIECLAAEKSRNLVRLGELERNNADIVRELARLKSEIVLVVEQRNANLSEIEGLISEKSKNLERLTELEKSNAVVLQELDELKKEFGALFEEKKTKEREIECLISEKSMILRRLTELEKSDADVMQELEGLKNEFGVLLEEKKAKQGEIDTLISERSKNLLMLVEFEREIEIMKQVNEEVIEEKNMLMEVKLSQEDKITELQSEVNEIRENLLLIQESNKGQLENNVKFLSEINEYKSALDQAVKERDDVKNALDEEKRNGAKLKLMLSEISKKMEETAKVIEELRDASDTVVAEKKEVESKYTKMAEEKVFFEKKFSKAQETITELEGTLKSKSEMFESALEMLRNTAMQLTVENPEVEGITVNERGFNGEMKHYTTELESIRAVFTSREEKMGEMQQEMEKLHFSVLDETRKKSFWTLVSSATAILAAVVSFAYAKGFR